MTTLMERPVETPAPTAGPAAEVARVDALDCRAPAAHRIGLRYVCHTHYVEVRTAYWEADSNLVLQHYIPAGHRCGDVEEAGR